MRGRKGEGGDRKLYVDKDKLVEVIGRTMSNHSTVLKREEMTAKIDEILRHVPRGPKGSPQNMFRAFITTHAQRVLSESPDASVKRILREAIQWAKKEYPDFVPEFSPRLLFYY